MNLITQSLFNKNAVLRFFRLEPPPIASDTRCFRWRWRYHLCYVFIIIHYSDYFNMQSF